MSKRQEGKRQECLPHPPGLGGWQNKILERGSKNFMYLVNVGSFGRGVEEITFNY